MSLHPCFHGVSLFLNLNSQKRHTQTRFQAWFSHYATEQNVTAKPSDWPECLTFVITMIVSVKVIWTGLVPMRKVLTILEHLCPNFPGAFRSQSQFSPFLWGNEGCGGRGNVTLQPLKGSSLLWPVEGRTWSLGLANTRPGPKIQIGQAQEWKVLT